MDRAFAVAATALAATFILAMTAADGDPEAVVEEIVEEVAETDIDLKS